MDAMFTGKYNHTLDTKGRIIVPAKFKKYLGELFQISIGMDGCLYIFPMERWQKFVEDLNRLPGTDIRARKLRRAMLANSCECEIDKQGRILINSDLRAAGGLTKDAVFVGVGDKIELWDKDRFDAANDFSSIEEIAESLTEYGISF